MVEEKTAPVKNRREPISGLYSLTRTMKLSSRLESTSQTVCYIGKERIVAKQRYYSNIFFLERVREITIHFDSERWHHDRDMTGAIHRSGSWARRQKRFICDQ
jgi:hypothetical protein